jgi:hypothetical protein
MSQTIQQRTGLNGRQLCRRLDLSYATLLRWRRRAESGRPLLARPGPRKLGPLPFEQIRLDVEALRHRRERSAGSTALYHRYRDAISRRELAGLISAQRQKLNGSRRRNIKHVRWKEPNLAWAIDATEYGADHAGRKLSLVPAADMASRFGFDPLVGLDPTGAQVARYLENLFRRHGAPLFLKRDNGSIFNDHAVDKVLAAHGVIPLNSPAAYPPYNGGIEKAIRELKETLRACLPGTPPQWNPEAIAPFARAAAHLRNCRPRSALGGHSAAEAYHHQSRSHFSQRERHAAFEWIRCRSNATVQAMGKEDRRSLNAAWRHAAESWLRCQGLITISVNGELLPHLPLNLLS